MHLLILDPGLSVRAGHNASMAEELAAEVAGHPGIDLTVACCAALDAKAFAGVPARFRPVFRLDGYARICAQDLADPARMAACRQLIAEDLAALDLSRYDAILMPTAYPLHLRGLADHVDSLAHTQLLCGLLMPAAFWAVPATVEPAIGALFEEAVGLLRGTNAFFYTESGRYAFPGGTANTPTLLPPICHATEHLMEDLAAASSQGETLSIGYFGSPFTSKGFNLMLAAIDRGLPPQVKFVIRLPPGHEDRCRTINAASPQVDATSRSMSNEDFLREMAAVDVVLALYDPQQYADRMSGIIPEAICVGRPLIVSQECTALVEFLDHNAPGSFLQGPYAVDSILAAAAYPKAGWTALRRRAQASAPVVRALKRASRYLAIAGVNIVSGRKGQRKAA